MTESKATSHGDKVRQAFDSSVTNYDRLRRRLVPRFDDFYGTALDLLDQIAGGGPLRCLELGAGTGLFTEMILDRFPLTQVIALDSAAQMAEQANRRLARFGARAEIRVADYRHAPWDAPVEAVVSALSIHHLGHDEKRTLFRRVHEALTPGGIFINADQSLGPTPAIEGGYQSRWVADVRAAGVDEADLSAALKRIALDLNATMIDQLAWLAEAGFAAADVAWKHYRFTVFWGRKAD